MLNVQLPVSEETSELAALCREQLDALCTYAAHLVGDVDGAAGAVAAGLRHALRYPPARLRVDGRVALYRAVTNACRSGARFPARPQGAARLFRRARSTPLATVDGAAASRVTTVKRVLAVLPIDRRAAILLRDMAKLDYREMGRALECSPEAAARLLAGARREFGTVYRAIKL